MRAGKIVWAGAGLVALLLLGLAAPAAAAGDCREECTEARVTCHAAGHQAHRVCREACSAEDGECRKRCSWALRFAKARCHEERLECRMACDPGASCDCVAGCGARLRSCREGLRECGEECRAEAADALEGCRELAQDGGTHEEVRACVVEAEQTGHQCGLMCRGVFRCGDRFVRCVGECRDHPL